MWENVQRVEETEGAIIRVNQLSNSRHTRWQSWFRHCVTNRKFSGPIAIGVNEISVT
jgi:hypothetical protein